MSDLVRNFLDMVNQQIRDKKDRPKSIINGTKLSLVDIDVLIERGQAEPDKLQELCDQAGISPLSFAKILIQNQGFSKNISSLSETESRKLAQSDKEEKVINRIDIYEEIIEMAFKGYRDEMLDNIDRYRTKRDLLSLAEDICNGENDIGEEFTTSYYYNLYNEIFMALTLIAAIENKMIDLNKLFDSIHQFVEINWIDMNYGKWVEVRDSLDLETEERKEIVVEMFKSFSVTDNHKKELLNILGISSSESKMISNSSSELMRVKRVAPPLRHIAETSQISLLQFYPKLWSYIRSRKLNPIINLVNPDKYLSPILGKGSVSIFDMISVIREEFLKLEDAK